MYDLYANAAKFKIGTKIETASTIGLDSNAIGTVIKHFDSDDGYLMRLKNTRNWIPCELLKHGKLYKTYLPINCLKLIK